MMKRRLRKTVMTISGKSCFYTLSKTKLDIGGFERQLTIEKTKINDRNSTKVDFEINDFKIVDRVIKNFD